MLPVLFAGAWTATRRSTRFTALEAIRAGSVSPPDSRPARAVVRSAIPLTIGLGLKDLVARGHRAVLLAAAIALTGAVVVTALSLDATLDAQPTSEASDFPDELLLLIYALDTVLLLISATTVVAVALLSVRERIRDYGVYKAIGVTPSQIVSTVVSSHAALAALASLVAIPLGIGLYLALCRIASGTTEDAVIAPWWSLALIPFGTVVVVAAATSLPAWLATRIRAAERPRETHGQVVARPVDVRLVGVVGVLRGGRAVLRRYLAHWVVQCLHFGPQTDHENRARPVAAPTKMWRVFGGQWK